MKSVHSSGAKAMGLYERGILRCFARSLDLFWNEGQCFDRGIKQRSGDLIEAA